MKCGKNAVAGESLHILKGVHANTEKDANNEGAQIADHRESQEGNPAAITPARANFAAIAASPTTTNSKVETKGTKMV